MRRSPPVFLPAIILTLAAMVIAAEPLPTAAAPLPVHLPPARAASALPAPIPRDQLQVDLGGGRMLAHQPSIPLDGTWCWSGLTTARQAFAEDAQLELGYDRAAFDDTGWKEIAVPLDWFRAQPKARAAEQPYVLGWYRRSFELAALTPGQRAVLRFGVASHEADLWVNGTRIGSHHGDFTPWEVEIGSALLPGRNQLALRIRGDFGEKFGAAGPAKHVYGSQWSIGNIKGGLWQSCSLAIAPRVRVTSLRVASAPDLQALRLAWNLDHAGTAPLAVRLRAVLQDARAGGGAPRTLDLGTATLAPGVNAGQAEFAVPGLATWSPEIPNLHYLTVVALAGDEVVAARSERFGHRTFTAEQGRFLLNGRPHMLFGENLTALKYGGVGDSPAETTAAIRRDLADARANGYDIVRPAHMPTLPELFDAADELGMMIYNEWGWCFTENIDPVHFSPRNLAELTEWVLRDHNHPSVVMWSGGNEVHSERELVRSELDKQVVRIRELDLQRRPVSSFSGSAYGYGTAKLETDVVDLHSYLGLGSGPWTTWPRNLAVIREGLARTYGARQRDIPLIVWEWGGFSWGASDEKFRPGDPADYLRIAALPSTWGKPRGIGFAGSQGLAVAQDPALGLLHGRRTYGRRIGELLRRDGGLAGFAPWFQDFDLAEARQWTQPVLPSLAGANGLPLRHPIAGRTCQQVLTVINDSGEARAATTARLLLAGADGAVRPLAECAVPALPPGGRSALPVTFTLPGTEKAGWWQLQVECGDAVLGYDLFVIPGSEAEGAIGASRRIALLDGGGRDSVLRWCSALGLAPKPLADAAGLAACDVVIMPPGCTLSPALADALRAWVAAGGDLLALEQAAGQVPVLDRSCVPSAGALADLVVPAHPVFAGLPQAAFDTSDGPLGLWVQTALSPLAVDVLAARGPYLGTQGVTAAICEGRLGKGRIFASQLQALELWSGDSVATRYLRQLAGYMLVSGATPATGLRAWQTGSGGLRVAEARCLSLDLRPVANRGFADETPDDGRGGWTDQGINDFRMMPLGRQTFLGVPFDILDPAATGDRACVVLGGPQRSESPGRATLPSSTAGIAVGAKVSRLFFLHTSAWSGKRLTPVLRYVVRYADGTSTEIAVANGNGIGDWWEPMDQPATRLAFSRTNDQLRDIGVFLLPWDNPSPGSEITTVEIHAEGKTLPIVVAITAERCAGDTLSFVPAGAAPPWAGGMSRAGSEVRKTGDGLPVIQPVSEGVPGGLPATRIALPAPALGRDAAGKSIRDLPVVWLRMPPAEAAKLPASTCTTLTFWVRSEGRGTVDVVLPSADWSSVLAMPLSINGDGQWRKVRLAIGTELKPNRGKLAIGGLRGELFLYHGRSLGAEAAIPQPVTVEIADPRFE